MIGETDVWAVGVLLDQVRGWSVATIVDLHEVVGTDPPMGGREEWGAEEGG